MAITTRSCASMRPELRGASRYSLASFCKPRLGPLYRRQPPGALPRVRGEDRKLPRELPDLGLDQRDLLGSRRIAMLCQRQSL
ncbi:MAG: hypothetical protein ACREYE_32415 [Gammaproteobacteria bacterium]